MENTGSIANPPLNDKRTINAWAFFDWANSSYALIITVAIFPIYFAAVTLPEVFILGMRIDSSSLFAFSLTASYLLLTFISPMLSGIADYGGKRMTFMRFFTVLGALGCMALFFFKGMDSSLPAEHPSNVFQVGFGTVCFMLGTIGFAGGLVFYNSYLPVIASEDQYDRVSARGFAYGFIGSVILLIFNLLLIQKPDWFGLPTEGTLPTRIAFLTVGLWWLGFAIIPFRRLPKDQNEADLDKEALKRGTQELRKVWGIIKEHANIKSFLFSFFCYSAGVQTILYLASTFATDELDFSASELIYVVLILQILAIVGAIVFARVSERKGNKFSLLFMLFIWIGICLAAYFVQVKTGFYIIACLVGLVMGGVQSMSRSTYSKFLPENTEDTTSYFSFYDILEKTAIVSGTFIFGLTNHLFGMRNSVLVLTVFFIAGIILLMKVKVQAIEPDARK